MGSLWPVYGAVRAAAQKMAVLEITGYCCSFTSILGVIMLAIFGYFEGTHTTGLGYHCKKSDEPCPQEVVFDNQTQASANCYTAAGVYAVFFVLSLACIYVGGRGGDSRQKPVM